MVLALKRDCGSEVDIVSLRGAGAETRLGRLATAGCLCHFACYGEVTGSREPLETFQMASGWNEASVQRRWVVVTSFWALGGRAERSALRRLGSSSPKMSSRRRMGSRPERERRTAAWASLRARATVRCWPSLPKRLAGRESMAREKSSRWGPAAVTRRRSSSSRRRSSWAGKSGSEPGR